jgi:Glycosyltransferase family 87
LITDDLRPGLRNAGPWAKAVAVQTVVAAAIVGLLFASGFDSVVRLAFADVVIYRDFATPVLESRIPYRDYPVEYPPLAFPFFLLPLVVGKASLAYKLAFAFEMLLVNAATVWLFARQVEESEGIERVPARIGRYSLGFAALCPLIVSRFDLVPMLLTFAAVRLLAKGRMAFGGMVVGLGVLAKIVPGVIILPFLARVGPLAAKGTMLAALAAIVILGGVAWWAVGGDGMLGTFRYHGERGLEIGSLYASAYLVAHEVAGVVVSGSYDHGSNNIIGPSSDLVASLAPIVQLGLMLLVAFRARAGGEGQEMRCAAATLLAYILPSKVLSPQYLIWLLPFVALIPGRTGTISFRIYLACCLLTTALFPFAFERLVGLDSSWPVVLLASRNLALIGLFAVLIRGRDDVRMPAPASVAGPGVDLPSP